MLLRRERRKAQSIIETVVGIIFLIPIVLLLFDVGVLVLGNTANDQLAKQAARAAAAAPSWALAQTAATQVVQRYQHNATGFISNVNLDFLAYNDHSNITNTGGIHSTGSVPNGIPVDPGSGNCQAITSMVINVPVAFPGLTSKKFQARAVEPVTSVPP